jgi:Fe-S cluster biosynthesis and repair protein YggX
MFPDFCTQFFHPFVFQVVQQRLIFTSFAEIEKRGAKFNPYPSVKQLGHPIFRMKMKIGSWNVVQTMKANPLFLLDELITASNAQSRENQFSQIIQNRNIHHSTSID